MQKYKRLGPCDDNEHDDDDNDDNDNDDNDHDDFRVGMVWPMEDFREVEAEVVWTLALSSLGGSEALVMMRVMVTVIMTAYSGKERVQKIYHFDLCPPSPLCGLEV